ncbi:MAG: hypothetical protein ACFFB7_07340 [Candidatus Sifarchaeia archaeon]
MGRTARTFRDSVRLEESRWKGFRRVLKPSNRETLDRVFDYAREYADAGTMIVTPRVMEVALVSTVVELLKEVNELQRKLNELEKGGQGKGAG